MALLACTASAALAGAARADVVPVTNGQFTSGLTGWDAVGASITSISSFGNIARLSPSVAIPARSLSQTLTNLVAGVYEVSFYARENVGNANNFAASVSLGSLTQSINLSTLGNSMTLLTYTFDVTAAMLQAAGNALNLQFAFSRLATNASANFDIDNVSVSVTPSVTPVPGPLAGAGLVPAALLLGGAWLGRRRWSRT